MNICVFCGSSYGVNPIYVAETRNFGHLIAEKGHHLIYGGGNNGLMGIMADAVLFSGGKATGVIPSRLVERERAHKNLTHLHIVQSMHERKAMMAELSDAFIALPGGLGTFDEFFEILTWNQLKFINKPAGLLNIAGYFDFMIRQLDFSVGEGFISKEFRDRVIIEKDAEKLLDLVFN